MFGADTISILKPVGTLVVLLYVALAGSELDLRSLRGRDVSLLGAVAVALTAVAGPIADRHAIGMPWHLREVAGDTRAQLHRFDGVEAAGVFVPFQDVALNGLAHRHGRRCVLLLGLRLGRVPLVTPRAQRQERDGGNQRADAAVVTPASEHTHYSSREGDLETNTQQIRATKAAGCFSLDVAFEAM